jgi:hypothetical protein
MYIKIRRSEIRRSRRLYNLWGYVKDNVYVSRGQDVDRGPPMDRETILGGPPVLHARG